MSPKGIQVHLTRTEGVVLATVRGEMDLASVVELETALEAVAASEPLVLDLSAVNFMDSSGLAVVLRQSMTRRDAGSSLLIRRVSGQVGRLLEFLCLGHLMEPGVTAAGEPGSNRGRSNGCHAES